jgi:hypothetical protein
VRERRRERERERGDRERGIRLLVKGGKAYDQERAGLWLTVRESQKKR